MRVDIVTIFPDYFAPLELSLIGRARAGGLLDVAVHDLRRWTHDVHRTVDDTPYGGGPGMVMRPEPWGEALDALVGGPDTPEARETAEAFEMPEARETAEAFKARETLEAGEPRGATETPEVPAPCPGVPTARLVVPTPAGTPFAQSLAGELAREPHLIFACGRYEGIDQRVLEHARTRMRVTEISLGDYVLFGGEVAVLVVLEAVVRLMPGVLGNADSLAEESHANGLLEAPVFTKPPVWRGLAVPDVLRSGDHGRIARWRRDRALLRTAKRRPDLLAALAPRSLDTRDVAVLAEAGFLVPGSDMAK